MEVNGVGQMVLVHSEPVPDKLAKLGFAVITSDS